MHVASRHPGSIDCCLGSALLSMPLFVRLCDMRSRTKEGLSCQALARPLAQERISCSHGPALRHLSDCYPPPRECSPRGIGRTRRQCLALTVGEAGRISIYSNNVQALLGSVPRAVVLQLAELAKRQ